ncbi:hypothetical protein VP01_1081g1 [Puccinia sorghi]|uniref:Uncharacterized protein n=1 Tax=Puccinia sorghi TaxID=27349 RepID=A0A0L6VTK3_9BASI|nr:hypothetical protein VP01_1081g1 [Puccinia sorghi]
MTSPSLNFSQSCSMRHHVPASIHCGLGLTSQPVPTVEPTRLCFRISLTKNCAVHVDSRRCSVPHHQPCAWGVIKTWQTQTVTNDTPWHKTPSIWRQGPSLKRLASRCLSLKPSPAGCSERQKHPHMPLGCACLGFSIFGLIPYIRLKSHDWSQSLLNDHSATKIGKSVALVLQCCPEVSLKMRHKQKKICEITYVQHESSSFFNAISLLNFSIFLERKTKSFELLSHNPRIKKFQNKVCFLLTWSYTKLIPVFYLVLIFQLISSEIQLKIFCNLVETWLDVLIDWAWCTKIKKALGCDDAITGCKSSLSPNHTTVVVFHLHYNAKSTWQRHCEQMSAQDILYKRRKCYHGGARIYTHVWTTITWIGKYVSTRNGTQDMSRLGDIVSQPGIEQRMYQDWETLCLNQGWNIGLGI